MDMQDWHQAQEYERKWQGDCTKSFGEEAKQITYASRMGLVNEPQDGHWPCYDLGGKSVIDIGGGPSSMLLKCFNGGKRLVVDPCDYPQWVCRRYIESGIMFEKMHGEQLNVLDRYDEAWIYNCLQHAMDPRSMIHNARGAALLVRIFEWVDSPVNAGHPHELKRELLDEWLGGTGQVEHMNGENGCHGAAYYGVFKGYS